MRRFLPFIVFIAIITAGCGNSAAVPPPTSAPVAEVAASSAPSAAVETPQRGVSTAAPTATFAPTIEPTATPEPSATPVPATQVVVEPTAAPAPAQAASTPNRIVISAIGLDQPLVSVGLDGNNVPIVPKHNVGWYNYSARPGQGDNIVLWGHVLRFKNAPNIPAPFARMKELAPGTRVVLYDDQGNPRTYAVTKQVWATPDQVSYILPQGKEMVTMVSCIGDKVIVSNSVELTHRLITIAEPAN